MCSLACLEAKTKEKLKKSVNYFKIENGFVHFWTIKKYLTTSNFKYDFFLLFFEVKGRFLQQQKNNL